jgi:hypothetical protein
MPNPAYTILVKEGPDKPVAWLRGELKTPPLSKGARVEAGTLLRRLQTGEKLSMPESRPLPTVDPRCHELRIDDIATKIEWRIVYYMGRHAIEILDMWTGHEQGTERDVQACWLEARNRW